MDGLNARERIRRLAEYFLFGSSTVTKIDGLTLNTTVGLKGFLNATVHSYPSVSPSPKWYPPSQQGEKWRPTNDAGATWLQVIGSRRHFILHRSRETRNGGITRERQQEGAFGAVCINGSRHSGTLSLRHTHTQKAGTLTCPGS